MCTVRHGDWKLQLPPEKKPAAQPKLFNLKSDIGEAADVAAENPEAVAKLQALAATMKGDLGLDGEKATGRRELGKVADAQPIIGFDDKPRAGFEAK